MNADAPRHAGRPDDDRPCDVLLRAERPTDAIGRWLRGAFHAELAADHRLAALLRSLP